MKVALIPNLTREHAPKVTMDVCKILDTLQVPYYFDAENGNYLKVPSNAILDQETMLEQCDVVIAIGGDGSLIHAAKKAVKYKKPVLGINAGHLAFMAGVEKNELDLLKELIHGNYSVDKRMLLEVTLERDQNKTVLDTCLNDVVIARGEQIKLVDLHIYCDDRKINNYYADGVIIATPTGSTAYSLSAGGPVVDPKIESILLTPICTHSLFARSIMFEQNSELKIEVPQNSTDSIFISCDGNDSIALQPEDKIYVKKSKDNAEFIRLKNDSFIDVLDSKLAQRRA